VLGDLMISSRTSAAASFLARRDKAVSTNRLNLVVYYCS
jgi:hypothetical protein